MTDVRVRFAPSPTGPLNVGGLRTALYDYLYARNKGGKFVLRIEDTDQAREVPGTMEYILDALAWAGISPDEGPGIGGDYGPYKQSERKHLYKKYAEQLVDLGKAYYSFDTSEELDQIRKQHEATNPYGFKYNYDSRKQLKNSITLSPEESKLLIEKGENVTIRLKIEPGNTISFKDEVRESVSFSTDEMDDKVIMKGDGMPTYHLANIVDDYLMKISHVIRGEEWLSSTPHHIFMYDALGWTPPVFAHLPLLLKPKGKGKLSKRDSAAFGFPVFPLDWYDDSGALAFAGFREAGFIPEALVNFLAFLGWNPGTDQEIFSLPALGSAFSLDRIVKSGARFDFEKAKWFNQQYMIATDNEALAELAQPFFKQANLETDLKTRSTICGLLKERVYSFVEMAEAARFFIETPSNYDEKTLRKKYKEENADHFDKIINLLDSEADFVSTTLQPLVSNYVKDNELSFGQILPIIRVSIAGSVAGPDLFSSMELIGKEEVISRLKTGVAKAASLQV